MRIARLPIQQMPAVPHELKSMPIARLATCSDVMKFMPTMIPKTLLVWSISSPDEGRNSLPLVALILMQKELTRQETRTGLQQQSDRLGESECRIGQWCLADSVAAVDLCFDDGELEHVAKAGESSVQVRMWLNEVCLKVGPLKFLA